MIRRTGRLLLVVLLICFLQLGTSAAALGSIQISLKGGSKPIRGALIQLYKAGAPVTGGYRLTEDFGGGFISEADVLTPELAEWLAGKAGTGQFCRTDREGLAFFPDLEEGLYLVTQYGPSGGYSPFEPFVITLPWDGYVWDITASPKIERDPGTMPDTSDPGTVVRGYWGMTISGAGLLLLLLGKKKLCV